MEEMINKELEEFQKELEIRNQKLRDVVVFEPEKRVEDIIQELRDKEVIL